MIDIFVAVKLSQTKLAHAMAHRTCNLTRTYRLSTGKKVSIYYREIYRCEERGKVNNNGDHNTEQRLNIMGGFFVVILNTEIDLFFFIYINTSRTLGYAFLP